MQQPQDRWAQQHMKQQLLSTCCPQPNCMYPLPQAVLLRAQIVHHGSVTGQDFNRLTDRKGIYKNLLSSHLLAAGNQYTWRSVSYWCLSSCILVLASTLYTRILGGVQTENKRQYVHCDILINHFRRVICRCLSFTDVKSTVVWLETPLILTEITALGINTVAHFSWLNIEQIFLLQALFGVWDIVCLWMWKISSPHKIILTVLHWSTCRIRDYWCALDDFFFL